VQITFPFFGDILGFIGALGTGPTTFWLPSLMWLILKKPKPSNVRPPTRCPLSATHAWPPLHGKKSFFAICLSHHVVCTIVLSSMLCLPRSASSAAVLDYVAVREFAPVWTYIATCWTADATITCGAVALLGQLVLPRHRHHGHRSRCYRRSAVRIHSLQCSRPFRPSSASSTSLHIN